MSLRYRLIENNESILSSPNLFAVAHEMLCIVRNNLLFIKSNNLHGVIQKISNIYISVNFHNTYLKRYLIDYDKYYFSLETMKFTSDQHTSDLNVISLFTNEEYIIFNKLISTIKDSLPYNNSSDLKPKVTIIKSTAKPVTIIEKKKEQTPVNVKIISDGDSNIFNTSSEVNPKDNMLNDELDNELDNIEKQMMELLELKEKEEKKLQELAEEQNKQNNTYADELCELNSLKIKERLAKENEEQRLNEFNASKNSYKYIETDIKKGKLSENNIPVLFKRKYPILKFMDLNGHLDTDNDYELYCELYSNMYDDEEDVDEVVNETDIFNVFGEDTRKKYNEFISTTKGTIPSIDDLITNIKDLDEKDQNDIMAEVNKPSIGNTNTNISINNNDKYNHKDVDMNILTQMKQIISNHLI
jgi:hypothetical protein